MNDCTIKSCSKCGKILELNEVNFRLKKIKGVYKFYSICRICEYKQQRDKAVTPEYIQACKNYYRAKMDNPTTREIERDRWRNASRNRRLNDPDYAEKNKKLQSDWLATSSGKQTRKVLNQKRRARLKQLPATLTQFEWTQALNYFSECCAVCGRKPDDLSQGYTLSADHWIPLTKGGGTTALNIIPLCYGIGGCNNSKHDKMPEEWLRTKYSDKQVSRILKRVQDYFEWVNRCDNKAA